MRNVQPLMSLKLWASNLDPCREQLQREPDRCFNAMVNRAIELYLRQKQAELQQYSADIEKAPA